MPQHPAWEVYGWTPPGRWVDRSLCRGSSVDHCDDRQAVAAVAECLQCPVLEHCRSWHEAQLPEARAYGAVAGQWWGAPSSRAERRQLRLMDPAAAQTEARRVATRAERAAERADARGDAAKAG